jgi:hypothetical protein
VLRCLLCMAAWQGPIPWVHCHSTQADSSSEASSWLVAHLRLHHPTVDSHAHGFLPWHLHAEPPGCLPDDPSQPRVPRPERLLIASLGDAIASSLERSTGMSGPVAVPLALPQGSLLAAAGSNQTPCSGHFFDAFAVALSLPLRFGVARC